MIANFNSGISFKAKLPPKPFWLLIWSHSLSFQNKLNHYFNLEILWNRKIICVIFPIVIWQCFYFWSITGLTHLFFLWAKIEWQGGNFKEKKGKRGETFWDHKKGMFLRKAFRLVVQRGTNRIEPTSLLIINKHLEYKCSKCNLDRLSNRPA